MAMPSTSLIGSFQAITKLQVDNPPQFLYTRHRSNRDMARPGDHHHVVEFGKNPSVIITEAQLRKNLRREAEAEYTTPIVDGIQKEDEEDPNILEDMADIEQTEYQHYSCIMFNYYYKETNPLIKKMSLPTCRDFPILSKFFDTHRRVNCARLRTISYGIRNLQKEDVRYTIDPRKIEHFTPQYINNSIRKNRTVAVKKFSTEMEGIRYYGHHVTNHKHVRLILTFSKPIDLTTLNQFLEEMPGKYLIVKGLKELDDCLILLEGSHKIFTMKGQDHGAMFRRTYESPLPLGKKAKSYIDTTHTVRNMYDRDQMFKTFDMDHYQQGMTFTKGFDKSIYQMEQPSCHQRPSPLYNHMGKIICLVNVPFFFEGICLEDMPPIHDMKQMAFMTHIVYIFIATHKYSEANIHPNYIYVDMYNSTTTAENMKQEDAGQMARLDNDEHYN